MLLSIIATAALAVSSPNADAYKQITVDSRWLSEKTIEVCRVVGKRYETDTNAIDELVEFMGEAGLTGDEQIAVLSVCHVYFQGVADGAKLVIDGQPRY